MTQPLSKAEVFRRNYQQNCSHGNTILFSKSLHIDKCTLCSGFLVWCTLTHGQKEIDAIPSEQHPSWHWHLAFTTNEALRMSKGIEMGAQGNG